jgi:glycosyltransferase involved in cell wall biosynthesis
MTVRLLVLTSHPIQYQAPLFRALAAREEIDLEVCFYSRRGLEKRLDPQFGVPVAWDIPLTEGYRHRFLRNVGTSDGPDGFWSLLNPEVLPLSTSKKFDAVWIQGWALASNWLAWLGASVAFKRILLRGESNGLEEPRGWKRIAKHVVLRTYLSRIGGVLTIGRLNKEFYKRYGFPDEKLFQTPYAVDNSFFFAQADRLCPQKTALRRQYGLQPDLPVVLYTGKLIAKKRPFDLIKAFQRIRSRLPCALALVGDGALRPELERFVAEQRVSDVHFLGFRNQSEIGRLYAMADVFVLPSSSEPWGLSLNEALCFGLPAVVSDQVGSGMDLIEPGVNGYRFACGDIEELAFYLERVLNSEEHAEMGRQSRRKIALWGIEQSVSGIIEALHTTVL